MSRDCGQFNHVGQLAGHPAGSGMAKVMKMQIAQLGAANSSQEVGLHCRHANRKHPAIQRAFNFSERFDCTLGKRHISGFPIFCHWKKCGLTLQINVPPKQAQDFSTPHRRLYSDDHKGRHQRITPTCWQQFSKQRYLFNFTQNPVTARRHCRLADHFDRILDVIAPLAPGMVNDGRERRQVTNHRRRLACLEAIITVLSHHLWSEVGHTEFGNPKRSVAVNRMVSSRHPRLPGVISVMFRRMTSPKVVFSDFP